jgi:hypothetical protein
MQIAELDSQIKWFLKFGMVKIAKLFDVIKGKMALRAPLHSPDSEN